MAPKRFSFAALAVVLAAAVAFWVSAGVLTIANGDPGPPRIGVLPSPGLLALHLLTGIMAVLVIRPSAQRAGLLILSALILLPWLPMPMPDAAFVWAGHLPAWLWIGLAVALAAPVARRRAPAALLDAARDPRRAPWLAALLAAGAFLAGAWQVFPTLPGGDEPHYLVITQSLLTDHDLKIENNHRRGDYRAFYIGDLKPDYLRKGRNGAIYSIHAPGLSAIIAPAFALFGYPGVVAFLALVSGCATALAWTAAWRVTHDIAASWFGWASVALSVPFFFQSFVAFPDGLGAAIVIAGVTTMITGRDASERTLFATGTALAVLPWLHTRFALLAVALGVLIAARNLGASSLLRRTVALFSVPAVSAAAWFWFFYAVYGTPNPAAPYGGYTQSSLSNLTRGVPGLLFDQQFGLIPNAPVYVCAGLGFIVMARRLPRLTFELLLLILPYALSASAYHMWWGGSSFPARFLVPVVLALAIPAAVWFTSAGRGGRVVGLGALTLSVIMTGTLAVVQHGALLNNFRDGAARWLGWISPLVNLTTGLPSLFQNTPAVVLGQTAVWAIAIAATSVIAAGAARRGLATHTIALVVGFTAAVAGMIALSIVWRTNHATPLTPTASNLELLRQYDPSPYQFAVRIPPWTRIPLADVVPSLTLVPSALRPDRVKRYGPALFVLLDGDVYMEPQGTWIVGGASARFLLERAAGQPMRLFVRNVPVANRVTLSVGRWREALTLAPREERLIDLPASGTRLLLDVASATGTRPYDVEPGNLDRRRLGVWIEAR